MNPYKNALLILLFAPLLIQCKKDDVDPQNPQMPEANYADSIKRDLWAYYDFNSNLNDKSGNNHNSVGFNNIQLTYDIWGNDASALNFNGINNYAVIEDGKNFPEGDFTISFLVMPVNTFGRIFQKADFNNAKGASYSVGFNITGTPDIVFNITKDENICDTYTDENNSTPLYSTTDLKSYAWYYITCKFEGGVQKIYQNGVLIATQERTGLSAKLCNNAPFYMGIWWLNDLQAFKGKLDELRIYTRGLSEDEVRYLSRSALNE